MEFVRFWPDLHFLACVSALTLAVNVEPPTDVTFHCHNFHNVLKWNYSQFSPGLEFRVHIGSIDRSTIELTVTPPTLQSNLSFLSEPNNDYHLTVRAKIGENESETAPPDGIVYSYYKDSLAERICSLDLPSVNVTSQQDGKVEFQFVHPWLLYHHMLPAVPNAKTGKKKSHDSLLGKPLPEFKYDVVITNQKKPIHHRWHCEESVCEGKLVVNPTKDNVCLTMTGEMQKILVRATQDYCAQPMDKTPLHRHMLIGIPIIAVVLLASSAFLLFMVYKKRTKPSSSTPKSMQFTNPRRQTTRTVMVPEVEPTSPTFLLSPSEENEENIPTVTFVTEPELRLPIGVGSDDDVENDGESTIMQGQDLDEDEQEISRGSSGYRQRTILVKLDQYEEAEGYRS